MRCNRQDWKLALSILLVSTAAVYLSNFYIVPTNYAREVFFYADYFITGEILSTGHVPKTASSPSRWGKIGTVKQTPIIPIFLSTYSLILAVPVSLIYTLFPAVPLVAVSMMAVLRRWGLSLSVGALISSAAAITLPATAMYLITPRPVGTVLTFSAVLLIVIFGIRDVNNPIGASQKFAFVFLIFLFLMFKFFRYPLSLVNLALLIGIVGLIVLFRNWAKTDSDERPVATVLLITISVLISLLIFDLPLPNYISKIQLVILNLAGVGQINPVSAYAESPATAYSTAYHSLLPLPILLPMAIIGGIYALFDVWKQHDYVSIVAVAWGAMAIINTVMYIASSEGWLVARGYFTALPIMFLGASRYLRQKTVSKQFMLASILLVTAIVMIVLQFSVPPAAIQTYEPGIKSGSQWGGEYVDEPIQTDQKLGSPMAAKGKFNAYYPRSNQYEMTQTLFYEDYDRFDSRIDGFVMYSKGMTEYGLRAGLEYHQPMSEAAYTARINKSDRIYANGEVSVLKA